MCVTYSHFTHNGFLVYLVQVDDFSFIDVNINVMGVLSLLLGTANALIYTAG